MKTLTLLRTLTLGLIAGGLILGAKAAPKKVLVVTVTTGFRHDSIKTAEPVLAKLGRESGAFTVDYARQPTIQIPQRPNPPRKPNEPPANADEKATTKYKADTARYEAAEKKYQADLAAFDPAKVATAQAEYNQALKESLSKLSPENLKQYDAVIFANTTGDLPLPDKQGFIDWVKDGHGFVAMHSGSDTFHGFPPYIEMLGGEFRIHHAQAGIECLVMDPNHPATKPLGESFCIEQEEVYLIKSFDRTKVHELLALDKHPNNKKEFGYFPVSWCKDFGKGKVFYTSLGHRDEVWLNSRYQKHILGGIKWALGLEPGDSKPQAN